MGAGAAAEGGGQRRAGEVQVRGGGGGLGGSLPAVGVMPHTVPVWPPAVLQKPDG